MFLPKCSFNPFRREEEREREEEETRPTPPPSPKPKRHKWAKDEDKILLMDLLDEKDPEGVSPIRAKYIQRPSHCTRIVIMGVNLLHDPATMLSPAAAARASSCNLGPTFLAILSRFKTLQY